MYASSRCGSTMRSNRSSLTFRHSAPFAGGLHALLDPSTSEVIPDESPWNKDVKNPGLRWRPMPRGAKSSDDQTTTTATTERFDNEDQYPTEPAATISRTTTSDDGLDRRGFLSCMAWAGTATVWAMSGGVPEVVRDEPHPVSHRRARRRASSSRRSATATLASARKRTRM